MKILPNNLFTTFPKRPVLSIAICVLAILCLFAFFATTATYEIIENLSIWVRNYFGYFYLYLGLGCVLFLLAIALSPLGNIKLGKPNSKPEHSTWSWVAMLYSAGMGAGILLRAVQEPVYMQQNPPFKSNLHSNILALEFTFYQWGFTAWAFYGLFAMVIGYALFVDHKKVQISTTTEESIKNPIAKGCIDILTIITTVFGLIAAIGLGTTQITGGLTHLTQQKFGFKTTLILTLIICTLAFLSAWKGLNKGIKFLSKGNILITLLLLLFVFFTSDILGILNSFAHATIAYIIDFIPMSLAIGKFNPGIDFLTDWTFYYWAFWIAWAPFTGIFIARISKGRTLRQLLLGLLIIPSLGTFFWFAVFGQSAFNLIQDWGSYTGEFTNVFTSIFRFLENYPVPSLLNTTSIILLIGFLVTSVDSAVFVLSMFTDNGKQNPSKKHRLLWSIFIFLATLALLVLANVKPDIDILNTVQKLLIITSLPFSFFMIVMASLFLRKMITKK
ncbi:glycine betaine transporter [Maribacter vaceletii]|uniref:Glycine betaine transporter n=1 Tax=Maribacter vaceletii TaxID=1206816 RepID=A0A495EAL5_9FLAO|nr:BCCT family transporter [Maribacter vaceletii]RKR13970.1 glycine betaine transporter [Maribacter vaceletii]